jgi:hypothetical protein
VKIGARVVEVCCDECSQKLREAMPVQTLIAWGTDDMFFDVKWSHWKRHRPANLNVFVQENAVAPP